MLHGGHKSIIWGVVNASAIIDIETTWFGGLPVLLIRDLCSRCANFMRLG